ncbi:MAG TPA: GNAT family N-acetyltransferase [Pyrinomonadaceae bacterium]|jgi:ribosomal protein S18 acetylase RimI-like enzyme
MSRQIQIRRLTTHDCQAIAKAFLKQDWHKPSEQFEKYLAEQESGERVVLVAEFEDEFAGYLTIIQKSKYPHFRRENIPEISDFNVLIKFRRRGIGAALMDAAENLIAETSKIAGIGVGLTHDYGAAQRLYVKRGYIPDGNGIFQGDNFLKYGDRIIVDDDLTLWLTKSLSKS